MVPPQGFLHEKNIALFCPRRKIAAADNLPPLC
jgi:hypothetical protein